MGRDKLRKRWLLLAVSDSDKQINYDSSVTQGESTVIASFYNGMADI